MKSQPPTPLFAAFIPGALLLLSCLFGLWGCEGTNVQLAAEAGMDAARAATLSDEAVQQLSQEAAAKQDRNNRLAPPENHHARRLQRLVAPHLEEGGFRFNFQVYLEPTVNAFALADGSIRFYSGLMEMMTDDELLFVIGHEMGHVLENHVKKKLLLAYAAQAVRKGIASQENLAGGLAASLLGGLVEQLVNAQFSQQEEREADDFGLRFLQANGYNQQAAVSALKKLASLGNDHSFLASHPAPGQRAERMLALLTDPGPPEESLWQALAAASRSWLARLTAWLGGFFT